MFKDPYIRLDSSTFPVAKKGYFKANVKKYAFWEMFFSQTTLTNLKSILFDIK